MIRESILAISLMGGANFADLHTTQHALTRAGTVEANPLIGPQGSRVVPVKLAVTAVEGLVYYKIRRKSKKGAWIYVGLVVGCNLLIAHHNSGMGK